MFAWNTSELVNAMWALDNDTRYAAERNWTRDQRGVHRWLVAVRASFAISPEGKLSPLEQQLPPSLAPEYRGPPGRSSLRLDSDLLLEKPTTDIILNACACAPGGKPAAAVPVSLRIGDLEKVLVVYGERLYQGRSLPMSTTSPRPFLSHPIHYEWAFGGHDATDPDPSQHHIDERNPVGRGVAKDPSALRGQPAHRIEYPSGDAAQRGPAGFGPIDRAWLPRRTKGGTFDQRWRDTKSPLLPDDYDERFAQSAPDDQQPPRPLRGGETLLLRNLTPQGTLALELPRLFFTFTTRFGHRSEPHQRHQLTTVFIDTEVMQLSMVWQSALTVLATQVEQLDQTTISEKRYLQ